MGDDPVIEGYLGDVLVWEHIPEHVGLRNVIQDVHMLLYLKQVILVVHSNRTILEGT